MPDRKALEDGKVLRVMIDRLIEEPSDLRMIQLLNCLTDCQVAIPCNARISEANQEIMKNAKVGDEIKLQDELGFSPDNLITPDGHRYIPLFSNESKADPEYIKHFSVLHMYISDLMPHYDNIKGEAEGFLLDYDVGIMGENIDIMKKMCEQKKNGTFGNNNK